MDACLCIAVKVADYTNRIERIGFMDELFESFDAWLEDVGQEILDEESKPMLLNPARLTQMQFVYAVLKKYALANDAIVTYKLNEPFTSMGSVTIEGEDFILTSPKWFARAAEMASNVEIYTLANGNIRITFTFHEYAKPIESQALE